MIRHALLQTSAAVLWGTTIITAFTGYDERPEFTPLDERLWLCTLGTALIVTWAAAQRQLVARFSKSNQALAQAVLTRPVNAAGPMLKAATGPLPVLSQPDVPPAVPLAERRKQLAHRAKRQ